MYPGYPGYGPPGQSGQAPGGYGTPVVGQPEYDGGSSGGTNVDPRYPDRYPTDPYSGNPYNKTEDGYGYNYPGYQAEAGVADGENTVNAQALVKKVECAADEFHCEAREECIDIEYVCDDEIDCTDGSDEKGCKRNKRAAILSAFRKTQVEIRPSRDQCYAGDDLELRCEVSGGDGGHSQVSWMKLNGRLGTNVREYGDILRFDSLVPENGGIYQCNVIGSNRKRYQQNFILTVQGRNPRFFG